MRTVLFVSKGVDAPSTRYRAAQFFPLLEANGFVPSHVKVAGGSLSYFQMLRQAATADIVVVLRKTFPTPILFLLRKAARRLVFDFDDSIFCNSDGSPSSTRMKRFAAMTRLSDHVVAGNAFLAERAAQHARAVTVVPTCVDVEKYAADHLKPSDSFDLVWIGSSSTRKYLVDALPALRQAATFVPGLRLRVIADFDLPDAGLPVDAVPWSAATEAAALGGAHVGIAPMRDDEWSRGKCALKVLQYMAAGLPVISSDAGANAEAVADGATGFLARCNEDWVQRIRDLASSPSLLSELGRAGRKAVRERYSVRPVFDQLRSVFESLS